MSQKNLAIDDEGTRAYKGSKKVALLRALLLKVLSKASEGHFVLKENGTIIAEVGSPSADLQAEADVLDQRAYERALLGGNTAAGEAYVDGWWTSPDITQVTRFFSRNLSMMDYWDSRFGWLLKPFKTMRYLRRLNSKRQAKKNILAHYDLGDELYQTFLDSKMQYSSAIFDVESNSLEEAQVNKLTRICDQLKLREDDHLLEVGSGWGGLAIFAAENYGCQVTTTTISDNQYRYAKNKIDAAGLSNKINLLSDDYRLLQGKFEKVVSVEMIEAVGKKYLSGYFQKLNDLLKPGGLLMLQAITIADQRLKSYSSNEDFIQKHIFPGGFLPSVYLISKILADSTELVMRDFRDIGLDYSKTLSHWHKNLLEKKDALNQLGYDDQFYNLWTYYLGYCEGGFLERRISASQMLMSKAPHT
ncbi:MAG: SAM-dependent methyltransferase [Gammaproteobacteria bacterium]|nr:SAM-dependent methyltransferase [Gammaproteobacteria bacterium]